LSWCPQRINYTFVFRCNLYATAPAPVCAEEESVLYTVTRWVKVVPGNWCICVVFSTLGYSVQYTDLNLPKAYHFKNLYAVR
jgi:hypothetical protein